MAEEAENRVLVYLRRIDAKVDALARDIHELKERVSSLETAVASVRRDLGRLVEADARLQSAFDRLRQAVGRIERRLDLAEEPAPSPR
jgi:predicted nuclease with TOPRIM domain